MKANFYEKLLNIKDEKTRQKLKNITKLMEESYNIILQKKYEKIIKKEENINIIKEDNKIIINNDKINNEFKHIYLYHNSFSINGRNVLNRKDEGIILT